jgi:hypothetical protein
MDWAALFKIFQSWGPSAISSALVVVVLYLIKRVNKNSEADEERARGLQSLIDSKINGFRESVNKAAEDHGRRLSCIEMEYVRRETFYRELGGWKDDINRVSGQISSLAAELNKGIVELWKERKRSG